MSDEMSSDQVLETLLRRVRIIDRARGTAIAGEWHRAMGALLALEQTGAMPDGDAERWRERLDTETQRLLDLGRNEANHGLDDRIPPPPRMADLTGRLTAELDELFANVASEREQRRKAGEPSHPRIYWQAVGVLSTLERIGLVREEDYRRWTRQLVDAASLTTAGDLQESGVTVTPSSDVWALPAAIELEDRPPLEAWLQAPAFTRDHLVQVLIVHGTAGDQLELTALGLYADGIEVTLLDSSSTDRRPWPHVELTDDVGTRYLPAGASGGSGGQRQIWRLGFAPSIAHDASTLQVVFDHQPVNVPLPSRAR